MWHVIQESCGLCFEPTRTVAQFRHKWQAELYKFWNYDILAEPAWKGSFRWYIANDKDLP